MSDPDQTSRPPRRPAKRSRMLAVAASIALHLLILPALLSTQGRVAADPPAPPPGPVVVTLVEPPSPPPPPPPPPAMPVDPGPSSPAEAAATPHAAAAVSAARRPPSPVRTVARLNLRPAPPTAAAEPVPARETPTMGQVATLSDAQLAGATTAGSGRTGSGVGSGAGSGVGSGSGRPCDMVQLLQDALRKDAEIQAAVALAHRSPGTGGKAILVWNGDWIRSPGQEGKGLAGVRQAIVMEVAFAPQGCRSQPMRGLVLISLGDAPGSARLVLGSGDWRWSDLLSARLAVPSSSFPQR